MTFANSRPPVVAILGGGLTGAAAAYHLARQISPDEAVILVIEPRESLGLGLAYGTTDPAHRINVPASKMTMVSAEPAHFTEWLARQGGPDPEAIAPSGDLYPRRAVFGAYVASHLRPYLESGAIRHFRARAIEVRTDSSGYVIRLSDGSEIEADFLALAMTHPRPGIPAQLRGLSADPAVVSDPYAADALEGIDPTARVLVVGTGLTSADVIASLDGRGHRGEILALSRHGYLSQRHAPAPGTTDSDFAAEPARSTGQLLRRIRAGLAEDADRGETWHPLFDKLRSQGPAIWAALDTAERARLVRHLRSLWDVHRFRIAPQVASVLDRRVAEGILRFEAARLVAAARDGAGITVTWRPRRASTTRSGTFDRVIVTTGPAHGSILSSNPAIASMAEAGLVTADPLGLGLATSPGGQAIGADGRITPTILIAGPLARGSVGELMGVPEVTIHAEQTADRLRLLILAARAGREPAHAGARQAMPSACL